MNQRKRCFLASDWSKFENKYRTLISDQVEVTLLISHSLPVNAGFVYVVDVEILCVESCS